MFKTESMGLSNRTLLYLSGAGVALLVSILLSELLLLPPSLETVGRILYRTAFFVILPWRPLVSMFIPQQGNHWPIEHFIIVCLAAPYLYWLLYHTCRQLWLRHRPAVRAAFELPPYPSHRKQHGADMSRRQFLRRSAAGSMGLAAFSVGGYASFVAPQRLRVEAYTIPIRGLPPELDGFRLVHVSDTHYGPYNALPYLRNSAEQASALDGDFMILTGDYVHHTPRSVEPGIGMLTDYRARLGQAAVLGNHDHWEGTEACQEMFKEIGTPLLDNARMFLTPDGLTDTPVPGKSICLAGVGDLWDDEVSLDKALDGVDPEMPRILLSHNPDVAEEMDSAHRVDLMLSGHTHGGQISIPGWGPPLVPSRYGLKYAGGLCAGPHCPVIVSRGVGVAFMPFRLGVPPELGVVTLKRA